jgi:hypothetical protein
MLRAFAAGLYYIPSLRVLKEGGYEALGSMDYF